MKKILIIIGIIVVIIAAFVIFFATQATPGHIMNSVRADGLENINGTITIPAKYTVIDEKAFAGKADIVKVIIKGEAEIKANAFYGCQNLREVVLEKTCSIGDLAFAYCPKLETVESHSAGGNCSSTAFYEHGAVTILCPEGSALMQMAQMLDLNYRIIE